MVRSDINQNKFENNDDQNKDLKLNQADDLRKLLNEVEEEAYPVESENKKEEEMVLREIDILQLPPRKEVHGTEKNMKWKVSKPFLRFALISLIIIAIVIGAFYMLDGEWVLLG